MTRPMSGTLVRPPTVAYFSMEIGLDPAMPTYCGGLGMLAGDALRAAAGEREVRGSVGAGTTKRTSHYDLMVVSALSS